jgi:hypothetical protein
MAGKILPLSDIAYLSGFLMTRKNKLDAEGFEDEEMFDETLKKLENDIKRARKKDTDVDEVLVITSSCFILRTLRYPLGRALFPSC